MSIFADEYLCRKGMYPVNAMRLQKRNHVTAVVKSATFRANALTLVLVEEEVEA